MTRAGPKRWRTAAGRLTTTLLLAALATGACAAWEPDLGPPMSVTCDDSDSDPARNVSFKSDVYDAILVPRCLPCHDPKGTAPVGFSNGGLDLTSLGGLRLGGKVAGTAIVLPYNPCASYLMTKLVGVGQAGERMPVGSEALTSAEVQTVHDWIAEGARDN